MWYGQCCSWCPLPNRNQRSTDWTTPQCGLCCYGRDPSHWSTDPFSPVLTHLYPCRGSSPTPKFHSPSLLRHFHWHSAASGPTPLATHCIRLPPRTFSPWYPCHANTHHLSLCLAGYQLRCSALDSLMHPVTTCQDPAAHHRSTILIPTPDARFDVVHIDLVGPLPPSQGFTYLLTCVDRYTRWPEAIPLTSSTAEVVAQALLSGWISRFGVPSTIITDCGRQFESKLWNNLMSLIGSKRARTTAYHPQTNGMVERFHRQLKAALKAQPNPEAWMDTLPLILLGIRTALKEDLHSTAAEMVYGTTLRLPGEFFTPSPITSLLDPSEFLNHLRTHFRTISPVSPRPTQQTTNIADGLAKASHVFVRHDAVRKPLQPPYDGPYPVAVRTNKHFTVTVNGRNTTISIDRLKPAHLDLKSNTEHSLATTESLPNEQSHHTPVSSHLTPHSHSPPPPWHTSIHTPTTPCSTRSGRRVHFPQYFSHHV